MKLFRVSFKVLPSKNHPCFWEIQFGFVQVWIYGESPSDAGDRALTVVEQLPYELFDSENAWEASTQAAVFSTDHTPTTEGFKEAQELARGAGVFVAFYGCKIGASVEEFKKMAPI